MAGGHYPAMKARDAREDAEIHWCDENGRRTNSKRDGVTLARGGGEDRGERSNIRMKLISTIRNEGSVHFMTYKETMTDAMFIPFMERMMSETNERSS